MKHLFAPFCIFRHPRLAIPFTFITFAKDYKNNRTDNTMKKSILLLFATLLPLVASAEKVEIDGIWYNLDESAKQAEVTSSDGTEYSGSITIPATVTHNGVNYSVTSIGDSAFDRCSNLTAITIPENSQLTSIGDKAFYYCTRLTAITLPEGMTSIGDRAFSYCSSLTDITIPEGVTSIRRYAFEGCNSLTTIVLPESVKYIYNNAFANCPELTDVYCYAESVRITDADVFDGSYIEYATLHVPASALETYKSKAPWSSFGTIVCLTDEDMSIEQLTNDNSQQTIYDLCGRRVTDIEKGGIYIVGGKKVIIK